MQFNFADLLNKFLLSHGCDATIANWLDQVLAVVILVIIAYVSDRIGRIILHRFIAKVTQHTVAVWDDIFLENKVFKYLVHILPGVIFYICTPLVLRSEFLVPLFEKGSLIFIISHVLRAIAAATKSMIQIYNEKEEHANKPVKVIFQVLSVTSYFVGGILIISILIDKSLGSLFAGLGASMAILLLVFKDSILGLVAGWQLSSNDMLRKGDWITVPKYGADGNVEELSLYSVKVRNFDNTITTIPPYILVSDSFQNWRGMQESGGRRIKRSIYIDMTSVKFCTPEMLAKFRKVALLKEYIDNKEEELLQYNREVEADDSVLVNGRRQTNIGVFRAYLQEYLRHHAEVNHSMSHMVRHLQPTEKGIPIELYFFTRIKDWEYYENVQADIFDHLLAVIEQFDLRVFQYPTGYDYTHSPVYRE